MFESLHYASTDVGSYINTTGLDAFLDAYDLSSAEGIVLMCLAYLVPEVSRLF